MNSRSRAVRSWGIAFIIAGLAGCASQEKRFQSILPGMTQQEVMSAMDTGPTRFERAEDSRYTSWYWDQNYCVLFQNGKVVRKDSRHQSHATNMAASCLAPGQSAVSDLDQAPLPTSSS